MSTAARLATRCSSCGTSFRVTEEQLQVSEGYVRCGRCDAVFNARGSLFDLDLPAPQGAAPATPALAMQQVEPIQPTPAAPSEAMPPDVAELDPPSPLGTHGVRDDPQWDGPDTVADDSPEPGWASTLAESSPSDDNADPNARLRDLLGVAADGAPGAPAVASAPASFSAPALPSHWASLESPRSTGKGRRFGWVQGLGMAAAAGLALALPLQWAWTEREQLRARFAPLDAWLQQHVPRLQAQGWQHLEGLSVASSTLQATPQGQAYRLELVVSNRAPHVLAMPSLDLSLNDAKGGLLLRRTLSPEQLGAGARAPLKPGERRKLQAVFTVRGESARVSGYELGLYHP